MKIRMLEYFNACQSIMSSAYIINFSNDLSVWKSGAMYRMYFCFIVAAGWMHLIQNYKSIDLQPVNGGSIFTRWLCPSYSLRYVQKIKFIINFSIILETLAMLNFLNWLVHLPFLELSSSLGYQNGNLKLATKQYWNWSEITDVLHVGLALYCWQRLITSVEHTHFWKQIWGLNNEAGQFVYKFPTLFL